MVYWLCRLDVSPDCGIYAGNENRRNKLSFTPLIPAEWNFFSVNYRYQNTVYHIKIFESENEETRIVLDGRSKVVQLFH